MNKRPVEGIGFEHIARGGYSRVPVYRENLDDIIGTEPSPDFAVLVAEQFQALLGVLPDDELRLVARLRLEEQTNAEIAARLQCSERTVERKLALIRGFWEEALPG